MVGLPICSSEGNPVQAICRRTGLAGLCAPLSIEILMRSTVHPANPVKPASDEADAVQDDRRFSQAAFRCQQFVALSEHNIQAIVKR